MMKRLRFVCLGMMWICTSFIAFSCKSVEEKAGEQIAEKMLESGTKGDVDVDFNQGKISIESEEGKFEMKVEKAEWPVNMPAGVLPLAGGKLQGVTSMQAEDGQSWTVVYNDVNAQIVNNYEAALKRAGYNVSKVSMGVASAISAEKDNILISLVLNDESTAILNVTQNNP